ncbi:hypothetical protein GJ744_000918 [Endocarpon pusillum]|uniref:VWFA domain-containing protein n=1 Tax=Endocarpon pusillum TaxID=364733 RepID=A0A8H7AR14_9EURO|nr:hypothetical protein GJ744_000918 [Endocarpon pusillum]
MATLSPAPTFCSQMSTSKLINMPFSFKRFTSKKESKSSISSTLPPTRISPVARVTSSRMTNPFATTTPTRRPQRFNDAAPPAYSPPTNSAVLPGPMQSTSDSPYAFLTQFDTIFLIDDSGSMAGRSWRETAAALSAITPICTGHDADGIDIYFLNHRNSDPHSSNGAYTNITDTVGVESIFNSVRPLGGTPTGTRLHHILKPYLAQVEDMIERQAHGQQVIVKPLNIIVITDGVASDDVESIIVQAAKKLDAWGAEPGQLGIQFFQVGHEPEAAEDLQELDDALSSAHDIRDIVDTIPWTGDDGQVLTGPGILKCVLGAVNRKLDRRRGSDERLRK